MKLNDADEDPFLSDEASRTDRYQFLTSDGGPLGGKGGLQPRICKPRTRPGDTNAYNCLDRAKKVFPSRSLNLVLQGTKTWNEVPQGTRMSLGQSELSAIIAHTALRY